MHKNSKLIVKKRLNDDHFNELMDHLKIWKFDHPTAQNFLKEKITGLVSDGYTRIHQEGMVCRKSWFVNDGAILARYMDQGKPLTYLVFSKGEMVIIPASWQNNEAAAYSLIGCPGTHMIEISQQTVQETAAIYPEILAIWNGIIANKLKKHLHKDKMLRGNGKNRVQLFYTHLPEARGPEKRVPVLDRDLATYIHVNPSSLSRLFKSERLKKKRLDGQQPKKKRT